VILREEGPVLVEVVKVAVRKMNACRPQTEHS
jgi:hypothetical protein